MATFDGIEWAPRQLIYTLTEKTLRMDVTKSKTFAVSRSIHYGLFLAFEGIRFYVRKDQRKLVLVFLNVQHNIDRFIEGIGFNLSPDQQGLVPTREEIFELFAKYLSNVRMLPFLRKMAKYGSQGYIRAFTLDDEHSIGVNFPHNPVIRVLASRYRAYLGEPFKGVVIPYLVRAVGANGTGRLKLGNSYAISVKALGEAKRILPDAGSALFLDDRPYDRLEKRKVTEWDSSCCLFALRDGSVIKIPESSLLLPSVTINGIVSILREFGVPVQERDVTYGQLIDLTRSNRLITVCSIGTAGILNRCSNLLLIDNQKRTLATMKWETSHPLFQKLTQAKQYYWDIYRGTVSVPNGLSKLEYEIKL
jgi:branched-chain amino acid aminotransferase